MRADHANFLKAEESNKYPQAKRLISPYLRAKPDTNTLYSRNTMQRNRLIRNSFQPPTVDKPKFVSVFDGEGDEVPASLLANVPKNLVLYKMA